MEEGIAQILGLKPFLNTAPTEKCEHEDDGHVYGETKNKVTLRCEKCGVHYEERIKY
jgi:hypothetical protein